MIMKSLVSLYTLVAALGLAASDAFAQAGAAPVGSVLTARPLGDQYIRHVQVGWPGISATLVHGYSRTSDVGGILTFNYGLEGDVTDVEPGLKLQGLVRLLVSDTGRFNVGFTLAPGPLLYFGHGRALFAVTLPVGLVFGIPVGNAPNIHFSVDMPLWVYLTQGGGAAIPILLGGGIERAIDRRVTMTFNARIGPTFYTRDSHTNFSFQALM